MKSGHFLSSMLEIVYAFLKELIQSVRFWEPSVVSSKQQTISPEYLRKSFCDTERGWPTNVETGLSDCVESLGPTFIVGSGWINDGEKVVVGVVAK